MHADETVTDAALVHRLLAAQFPRWNPHACSVCRARHTCHTGTWIAQTRYWCGFARPEAPTEESATSGRSLGDSRVNLVAGA